MRMSSKWSLSLGSHQDKILYAPLLFLIHATCPAHLIFLDCITQIIFREVYRTKSSLLCSLLPSPVTSPLRPKYLPQYLILRQSQWYFIPSSLCTITGILIINKDLMYCYIVFQGFFQQIFNCKNLVCSWFSYSKTCLAFSDYVISLFLKSIFW